MANVNVNLSDELQQFVDRQVETGQFDGPEGYIEALVAQAKKGKDRVDALLIEGLESGDAIPLDGDEWSRVRAEVGARLSNGQ